MCWMGNRCVSLCVKHSRRVCMHGQTHRAQHVSITPTHAGGRIMIATSSISSSACTNVLSINKAACEMKQ